MGRFSVLIAGLAAAMALASGATAAPGDGTVYGFGSGPGGAFAIWAQGGPAGATGYIAMQDGRSLWVARVKCMIVVGNGAWVVGNLTRPGPNHTTELIAEIVDNGSGNPPRDQALIGFANPPPAEFGPECSATPNFSDAMVITRGDFVVRPG
jgi:hypothetical protein